MGNTSSIPAFSTLSLEAKSLAESTCSIMRYYLNCLSALTQAIRFSSRHRQGPNVAGSVLSVFIADGAGFKENQHPAVRGICQALGHGDGIDLMGLPVSVQQESGNVLTVEGQGQIGFLPQFQVVNQQGRVVGSAVGLAQHQAVVSGKRDALNAVWGCQDHIRHRIFTVAKQPSMALAHVEAQNVAAVLAAVCSWGGEIQNVSILVAIGVSNDGCREIIGAAEGMKEDKESWRSFFVWLKERGLTGVSLIIGDKNLGMRKRSKASTLTAESRFRGSL